MKARASHSPKKQKTFVVLNPVAGQMGREVIYREISRVCEKSQIHHYIHETTKDEDLHATVKKALLDGYQQFLAVGGDGTVSGVASGLANTAVPVVVIPTGTANALAKRYQIPMGVDQTFSWWLASQNEITSIDGMQIGERFYFLNISVGTSSKALSDVKRQDKRKYGSLIYLLRGLQRLWEISRYQYQFGIDDQVFACRASELIVANSGIIQFKPLRLNPKIRMDDGKLSVCYIRIENPFDYVQIAAHMVSGHPTKTPQLTCKDALREVWIQTDQTLPVQADGELIGSTPVSIKLVPAATRFLIPEGVAP
jgi:YegS/Rv2252/BmrU family lipid kinase